MIGIIDYNMGNIGSISNMIKRVGSKSIISSDPDKLKLADKLILPGVGKFDSGMNNLKTNDLDEFIKQEVKKGKNLLGICLGMQLLTNGSEEGLSDGLGLIDAEVLHFSRLMDENVLRIPHMGWNNVKFQKESALKKNIAEPERFYFVHSYFVKPKDESDILMSTYYNDWFCSAVEKNNVFGVQFHPEKSHRFGMELLRSFINI